MQPFQVLCDVRRPGVTAVGAAALGGRVAPAAGPVIGLPVRPVDPARARIARSDIDVLHEGNDRDVDVAVVDGHGLELREQVLGRRLQRADLARVRHRAGVVEHQRDAQPRLAPGDGRRGAQVDRGQPERRKIEERRRQGGGTGEHDLRAAGVRIGRGDARRGEPGAGVDRRKQRVRLRGQRTRSDRRRVRRKRERRGVERHLHLRIGEARARVIDAHPDHSDQHQQDDGEHRGEAAALVPQQTDELQASGAHDRDPLCRNEFAQTSKKKIKRRCDPPAFRQASINGSVTKPTAARLSTANEWARRRGATIVARGASPNTVVIAGLVPATPIAGHGCADVDRGGRDKPGHDPARNEIRLRNSPPCASGAPPGR